MLSVRHYFVCLSIIHQFQIVESQYRYFLFFLKTTQANNCHWNTRSPFFPLYTRKSQVSLLTFLFSVHLLVSLFLLFHVSEWQITVGYFTWSCLFSWLMVGLWFSGSIGSSTLKWLSPFTLIWSSSGE